MSSPGTRSHLLRSASVLVDFFPTSTPSTLTALMRGTRCLQRYGTDPRETAYPPSLVAVLAAAAAGPGQPQCLQRPGSR